MIFIVNPILILIISLHILIFPPYLEKKNIYPSIAFQYTIKSFAQY